MLMLRGAQLQIYNRLTMLADLQLDLAQKHQPHMTLDVCWHQMLVPDQITMISTLCGSKKVYDHQKERSLKIGAQASRCQLIMVLGLPASCHVVVHPVDP